MQHISTYSPPTPTPVASLHAHHTKRDPPNDTNVTKTDLEEVVGAGHQLKQKSRGNGPRLGPVRGAEAGEHYVADQVAQLGESEDGEPDLDLLIDFGGWDVRDASMYVKVYGYNRARTASGLVGGA